MFTIVYYFMNLLQIDNEEFASVKYDSRISGISAIRDMEPSHLRSSLWEDLPSDVLEIILAKLPISALLNFSRVCKRWECYIKSAEFARRCSSVQPVLFYHYPGEYGLPSGKTVNPYLAIPSTKSNTWEKHTLDFASEEIYLVAADHGLVCFKTDEKRGILFIYNPVTRQFKKLMVPGKSRALPRKFDPKMLVGLIVDQETGNYKLVVGFVERNVAGDEEPRGTHVYDSLYSMWTSTSECPTFPADVNQIRISSEEEWIPGVSVRSGRNFYWVVDQSNYVRDQGISSYFFRFLLKYDIETGSWTIEQPFVPSGMKHRIADYHEFPGCLPRDLPFTRFLELPERDRHRYKLPAPLNFHLSTYEETVFITLFDSLIRKNPYSGAISSLIPEVKVIPRELVQQILDCADAPGDYLPTKVVAQNDTWYVAFEYHGIFRGKEPRPLRVFAYSPHRNVSRWLPELHLHSSCPEVLSSRAGDLFLLPELHTFTAAFRAFV
ncbi:hypothetical protein R1sor_026606 [Riccia sorocarpa]|uniref:F-box domain-containing protein n=1 Tax=Riccia sorocarpa TaxID=122646 RepID=A0ABD3GCI9_9MARC